MAEFVQKFSNHKPERDTVFLKCIKKAADITHTLATAEQKVQKADMAIGVPDKATKWSVLQEYLKQYTGFINSLTGLCGIYVYPVDQQYYEQVSEAELNRQLQTIKQFVYLREAMHSVKKDTFKQGLKKLLKDTGLFTEKELEFL